MRDLQNIVWPSFLLRVQSLSFSITDSHRSHFTDMRKVSTENVLHSLCAFLGNNHGLTAFSLDFRRFNHNRITVVAQAADLHALLLLDPMPKLNIEGGGIVGQPVVDSKVDLRTVGRLSMTRCLEFNTECHQFRQILSSQLGNHTRDEDLLDRFAADTSRAFHSYIARDSKSPKLSKKIAASNFASFMSMVRNGMERFDIPLHGPIIDALDKLLHFEVDVVVARYAAERYARDMEADEVLETS